MKADRKRNTKKSGPGKKIVITILILIVALVAGFLLLDRQVGGTKKDAQIIKVVSGSGTAQIAQTLKDKNMIRSTLVFRIESKATGSETKFQAGTYRVDKTMTTHQIIKMIADGDTAGKTFIVDEGTPIYKIADQMERDGICTVEEFYDEIENGKFDYDFLKKMKLSKGPERLEGLLYPDTYEVDLDAGAHEAIDVMLKRFQGEIVDGGYEEKAKAQGLTLQEAVTKASVVQKEAASSSEMKKVSSVIDNRIKQNMPLQMDSIVSYIHKEDKIRATYADIAVESDYNPYKNTGLPPGPICSVGKAAMDAAVTPDETKYLYFVASPKMDGTNVYSTNYKDFLKDKKAFDKAYEKYIKENPEAK